MSSWGTWMPLLTANLSNFCSFACPYWYWWASSTSTRRLTRSKVRITLLVERRLSEEFRSRNAEIFHPGILGYRNILVGYPPNIHLPIDWSRALVFSHAKCSRGLLTFSMNYRMISMSRSAHTIFIAFHLYAITVFLAVHHPLSFQPWLPALSTDGLFPRTSNATGAS